MVPNENGIVPCLIHIDVDGRWFHKGVEMVRRDFVHSFFRQMELDDAGRYIIFWGGSSVMWTWKTRPLWSEVCPI
jgi:hypothetical protein